MRRRIPELEDAAVIVDTPSGGFHVYFLATKGVRYPGTAGPGVDIKHNGYVLAENSPHWMGERYKARRGKSLLDNDTALTELPDGFLDHIRASKEEPENEEDEGEEGEDEEFADYDPKGPLGYSEEQIRDLLMSIPNDSDDAPVKTRDDWLKIGMALHHETDGADWALDLWDEWTAQHPTYDGRSVVEGRWESFGKRAARGENLVTFRHIKALARDTHAGKSRETVDNFCGRLASARDEDELTALCDEAKKVPVVSLLQREKMVAALKTAWKRISVNPLSTAKAEKMLRYENPNISDMPGWLEGIYYVVSEGGANHKVVSPTNLFSEFNGFAYGSLVSTVEEIMVPQKTRTSAMESIKPLITNDVVAIREMRKDAVEQLNTTTYFLLTNHRDALAVTSEDTRYFVIFSALSTKEKVQTFKEANPDVFSRFHRAIADHREALARFIIDHLVHEDFSPTKRAPDSRSRNQMAAAGKSERDDMLDAILERGALSFEPGLWPELLSMKRLKAEIEAWISEAGEVPDPSPRDERWLNKALQRRGFNYLCRIKLPGSGDQSGGRDSRVQVRVWSQLHTTWEQVPRKAREAFLAVPDSVDEGEDPMGI